jgi:DNA polymerase delta subunit 1
MTKKRYAGLLWTNKEKYEKIDCKGIENVRRDNCSLVQEVVNNCLKKILIERSYEEAIEYIKKVVSDLLQNRVDLSLLVITKGLGKKEATSNNKGKKEKDTYQVKNAHTELAKKLRERDANNAPTVGDRVSMVMIRSTKNANCYEKSEDPLYALEHDLPIDYQYYLDHHLKQPLIRLFEPIL